MKLLALFVFAPGAAAVVAQTSTPSGGDWASILTAYGVAAPFALLCLWQIRLKDKEIEQLRADNAKLIQSTIDRVVPAALELSEVAAEANKALQGATVMMHNLAGRGFDGVEMARLSRLMRDLEVRLDKR